MKPPSLAMIVALTGIPGIATISAIAATYTTVTVQRVVDGDTLLDANGKRYRLIGLDAPEAKQEYGQKAKIALEELVLGQTVDVTTYKVDAYGRDLATIRIGETDINAEMVRLGHAWNDPIYPPRNRYVAEEREAVCARRGLWAAGTVPPWQYRDCGKK